ncbi:MAG: sensor histidine kinase [Sphingomonadaceae bacterium]
MIVTPPVLSLDILCLCAALLGAIALLLLHRCQRLASALQQQRRARAAACSESERLEQALLAARSALAQSLAQQERIKETERRRIGHDLHDDLGQHLLALTMEVCALAHIHPRIKQPLAELDGHLRCAIRSLRTVVRDLLPEPLENGLRSAVEQQLAQFTRLSGIHCRLDADAAAFRAAQDSPFQAMLYRILQESLSNIARHAQATQVDIGLCQQGSLLCLTVQDNGVGLPASLQRPRRRCGLDGIEQRVCALGGAFHLHSAPGQGTALSLSFPLELALCQETPSAATAQ